MKSRQNRYAESSSGSGRLIGGAGGAWTTEGTDKAPAIVGFVSCN